MSSRDSEGDENPVSSPHGRSREVGLEPVP